MKKFYRRLIFWRLEGAFVDSIIERPKAIILHFSSWPRYVVGML